MQRPTQPRPHNRSCVAAQRSFPISAIIRNTRLVEEVDCAVFFWDGKSKAVAELIEKAEAKGISVEVVRFTSPDY